MGTLLQNVVEKAKFRDLSCRADSVTDLHYDCG